MLASHLAPGRLRLREILGSCFNLASRRYFLEVLLLLGIRTKQLHRVRANWCTEDPVLNVAAINMYILRSGDRASWYILMIKPISCTNFSNLFLEINFYMFQTVPLSIIRSFSPYTQQWYMSNRFADSLKVLIPANSLQFHVTLFTFEILWSVLERLAFELLITFCLPCTSIIKSFCPLLTACE